MLGFVVGITVPKDHLAFLLTLFISIFFSLVYHHYIAGSCNLTLRQFYIVAVGHLLLAISYGWRSPQLLHVYVPVFITFIVARAFRGRSWMPPVIFVGIMVHLSYIHLRRQFAPGSSYDRYDLDISGPLMMLVIKLTSFAADMYDSAPQMGSPSTREQFRKPPLVRTDKASRISLVNNEEKFSELEKYPSFLEFLGYCLMYPGYMSGPLVPFYEYRTFLTGKYFEGLCGLEGRKKRAVYLVVRGFSFLIVYLVLSSYFPASGLFNPTLRSAANFFGVPYITAFAFSARAKFYFTWSLVEASYVLLGLGFRRGSAGKPSWDRFENANPWIIETSANLKTTIGHWNVSTNSWLHAYVYRRVQKLLGKERTSARASVITYLISAWWHGFYPGYYLSFSMAAWMSFLSGCKIPLISVS